MRWRVLLTICRKELLETIRDRRTMVIMLFLPVLLYPALLIGFSQIISHQFSKLETTNGRVMIVGDAPEPFLNAVRKNLALSYVRPDSDPPPPIPQLPIVKEAKDKEKPRAKASLVPQAPEENEQVRYPEELKTWASTMMKKDKADVVLILSSDFSDRINAEGTGAGVVFYDETSHISLFTQRRLQDLFHDYKRDLLDQRKARHPELSPGFDRPMFWNLESVASAEKRGGYFAGMILPMMMIVMVMLGAFYPAVDLTAGEKERGTMQTLMTAPALPLEIIFGKFMAVCTTSILSALANLGSMALALVYLQESNAMAEQLNFQLDFTTGLILLLQLVPVAVLFSALMIAVSVFAKSFKEAQNYLTPLYLVVIIPVVLTALPGTELTRLTAWLPVMNITLLIKEILVEPQPLELVAMVLIANLLYGIIALVIAVRIFRSEEVLLGGQGGFVAAFSLKDRRRHATPGLSFLVFSGGLVVFFYLGSLMQRANIVKGLVASQYLLLLLPVLLIAKLLRLNFRDTFSTRVPNLWGALAAVCLGATSWAVLGLVTVQLQEVILPQPPQFIEMMKRILDIGSKDIPLWLLLFAFAFTPAICEEFMFRGIILSGFRQGMSKWTAIFLTAACFGVFHISIYRIMPTAVIGIMVSLIVWETRSIWAGVLFHMLHNGLAILITKYSMFEGITKPERNVFDWPQFSVLFGIFVLGLAFLVLSSRSSKPAETVPE